MKSKRISKKQKADWTKFDKLKDTDIDTSDIPELGEDFFRNAELIIPKPKTMVSIRLDDDILTWFRKQGKGYQTKINEILRMYMRAKAA
jgi:uncharacterized protein (DUF4415 family)